MLEDLRKLNKYEENKYYIGYSASEYFISFENKVIFKTSCNLTMTRYVKHLLLMTRQLSLSKNIEINSAFLKMHKEGQALKN